LFEKEYAFVYGLWFLSLPPRALGFSADEIGLKVVFYGFLGDFRVLF
jgi:hypothetical protein